MKRTFIRILLAGMLLLFAASSSGEIYRWVDEKGVTHFSDRKPDNSSDSTVQSVKPNSGTLSVIQGTQQPLASPAQITPPAQSTPSEESGKVQLNRNAKVEIYTTNW